MTSYPFAPSIPSTGTAGRVSVVIVHYAGGEDLHRCVRSVLDQGHEDLELILVDNGRAAESTELPVDPRIRRVWMPRNVGFAVGANAGLQEATGEVLLLLNPDAALRRHCLRRLLAALDHADIAAPRLLLAGDPDRLDNCGHHLYPDGLNWCRGRGERAAGRYEESEDILLFSGAAVAFRRAALAQCGAFDPAYEAYGEDADLALRAARLGLRCRYVADAVVTHRVGGAYGRHSVRKAYLVERNRARVAATHLPLSWLVVAPLWTGARVLALGVAGASGRGVVGGFRPADRALLPIAVGAAWVAGGFALPGALRRRRALADRPLGSRLRTARIGVRALLRRPSS